MHNQLTPADKLAYETLLERCAEHIGEPLCGRPSLELLPKLKPEEMKLVCRCFELDVQDCFVDQIDYETLADDVLEQDFCQLGCRIAVMLEQACRRAIALDVATELEAREEREHDAEWVRGPLEEAL